MNKITNGVRKWDMSGHNNIAKQSQRALQTTVHFFAKYHWYFDKLPDGLGYGSSIVKK